MKWFNNLKISYKLILTFIMMAAIAVAIGGVGILNMKDISNADKELYNNSSLGIAYIGKANVSFLKIRVNLNKLAYATEEAEMQTYIDNFEPLFGELDEYFDLYEDTINTSIDREMLDKLLPEWENYKLIIDKTINEFNNGNKKVSVENLQQGVVIADKMDSYFDEMYQMKIDNGGVLLHQNIETADLATFTMVIAMIIGVVAAVLIGYLVARSISKPLHIMVKLADKLALGDVEIESNINQKDEIGELDKALSKMVESIRYQAHIAAKISEGDYTVDVDIKSDKDVLGKALALIVEKNNELISKIAAASETVLISAKQISDSSIVLSEGSTEQASSVEELTASLEEVSAQTRLNADNATKANELSTAAKAQALQGNAQMKEMLKSMEEINEASSNINKIIKVIDDIAFQTNILALNAAVEAARAGQHGKGFAVVAEEVKNLSARSANAAKETTEMIESSIKKTEAGTKIARNTAEALDKIVSSIDEVSTLVNDIAIASNEQALGVEQINQGLMQVSHVVQNNTATSEENAAASEELSGQAEGLRSMIGQFKLKKTVSSSVNEKELNPEILKIIEGMALKNREIAETQFEGKSNTVSPRPQIVLNDSDFGKY